MERGPKDAKAAATDKGPVVAGYFHNLWDTQMGEETKVNLSKSATADELAERVAALHREVAAAREELGHWKARDAELSAAPPGG